MYLPNREQAFVHEDKIVKYLLDLEHEEGGPKAVFFMRFGFARDRWSELAEALLWHAHEYEVIKVDRSSPFGVKYTIVGRILAPDGRRPNIRAIWTVLNGSPVPKFTTAFPE